MSTYTGPINPDPGEGETSIIIYTYVPSLALGIVGAVTYGLAAGGHIYWSTRWRLARSFHALLAVAALMELGGYIPRTLSHNDPYFLSYFVAQYFLIVVAPVLITAAIYLSLSLVVQAVPEAAPILAIRPKTLLAGFITADVLTTIVQVLGAALVGVAESNQAQGDAPKISVESAAHILLAGLCVQAFSFICFIVILAIAISRMRRHQGEDFNGRAKGIKTVLRIIAVTSFLVLLRIAFRLAAEAQGFFGYANTTEWLFGVLEYMPIIVAMLIWAVAPPGRYLVGRIGDGGVGKA